MKKRNENIDFIKGIAIFLVVYGHVIQYTANGNYDFFDNTVFKIIYMFHMPLFSIISGYLFYNTKNNNIKNVVKKKFLTLILPIISWVILIESIKIMVKLVMGKEFIILNEFYYMLKSIPYALWFLWGIFYCSIVILIIEKKFKGNKFIYLFSIIISMLIPDFLNSHLYKYIYLYFLLGYILKKYKVNFKFEKKTFFIIIILFSINFILWEKETYIYNSKIYLFENLWWRQLLINLFRYFSGIVGIYFFGNIVFLIFNRLKKNKFKKMICTFGKQTLGIYIISGYLTLILEKIYIPYKNYSFHIISSCSLITIILIFISLYISKLLLKFRVIAFLFLGNNKKNYNKIESEIMC